MAYQPIENYGLIGNMRSCALVGVDGSIDWYCAPRFDSPSLFGALLDDLKGGRFRIASTGLRAKARQFYWPGTNVLVTRFQSVEGVAELTDFMALGSPEAQRRGFPIVRRLHALRGELTFELECRPAFDFARSRHQLALVSDGAVFDGAGLRFRLSSAVPLEQMEGEGAAAHFRLREGESAFFVFEQLAGEERLSHGLTPQEGQALFESTVAFWRQWLRGCSYAGRWRETVERSALALKLLTYEPTGAIVAAPTCSLPETIGGGRNWDYRYTWMRDAAFTIYGLLRIGFTEEAASFMDWLEQRCHEIDPAGELQIVYGIDGRHDLEETTLDHLDGYMGTRPVRIGNGAYQQLQLDIYGELLDSVYLFNKYGAPISYDLWRHLRRLTDWVSRNWQRPDEGIWEVRSGRQHFVYSKLMCWVAMDRALRLAERRSFPADRGRWESVRDAIYESIMVEGWSEERKAFVQTYGGSTLDASNLIMPLVFFLAPNDPRMVSTIDAINKTPRERGLVSDSLVYRYDTEHGWDGFLEREGTFNMCTFWLVEALTRRGARDPRALETARIVFERMLGYANHVGLYAEQIGPGGEALGNFPQAFTHLSLISAAVNLDRTLGVNRP